MFQSTEMSRRFSRVLFWDLVPLAETKAEGLALSLLALCGKVAPEPEQAIACLEDHLREKNYLLLVDNCEHLLEPVKTVVECLLRRCPSLVILATSRVLLGVVEETILRLEPLPVPEMHWKFHEVNSNGTAKLFREMRGKVYPGFRITEGNRHVLGNWQAIAEICRYTEGIPLFVRIAAEREEEVEDILSSMQRHFRIDGQTQVASAYRQRNVRNCITWSYSLLGKDAAEFFPRMSLLAGEWTRETYRILYSMPRGQDRFDTLFEELLNASLIQRTKTNHYRMLEPIRACAYRMLMSDTNRVETMINDLSVHIHNTKTVKDLTYSGANAISQPDWEKAIMASGDNLLDDLHEDELNETAIGRWITVQMQINMLRVGQGCIKAASKSLPVVDRFVKICKRTLPEKTQMDIHLAGAAIQFTVGNYLVATEHAAKGLTVALAAAQKDRANTLYQKNCAFASSGLGVLQAFSREMEQAKQNIRQGMEFAQEMADNAGKDKLWAMAMAYMCRGAYCWHRNEADDLSQAQRDYADALNFYKQLNHLMMTAFALNSLAHIVAHNWNAEEQQRLQEAAELYLESIDCTEKTNNLRGQAGCVLGAAGVAYYIGDTGQCAVFLGAAKNLYRSIGSGLIPPIERDYTRIENDIRHGADFPQNSQIGQSLSLETALQQAREFFCSVRADTRKLQRLTADARFVAEAVGGIPTVLHSH